MKAFAKLNNFRFFGFFKGRSGALFFCPELLAFFKFGSYTEFIEL